MLIQFEDIQSILSAQNIRIDNILHIGAHECEEIGIYNQLGVSLDNILWLDAIPTKVAEAKARGIPNVYNAVVTDKDDENIVFNISNFTQSSSILEFGTHSYEHPGIVHVNKIEQKSITIDTFFQRNGIDASKYNFWNFDIQGAELMALKGATQSIQYPKAIYLEVSETELYVNCGLIGEMDEFLAKHNFKRVKTVMTRHTWGDALYIRCD